MRPTLGGRSFTFAASTLWNSLLAELRVAATLSVLKSALTDVSV